MKEIIELFKENKILKISIVALYFMILIIIYNFFCYTIGIDNFKINIGSIKHCITLDIIFSFLYTYIGNLLMLMIMNNKKYYKEILIVSIPISLVCMILSFNKVILNIFLIFIYFFYNYLKENKISSILKTFSYLVIISILQCLFYYFKYYIFNINYNDINSGFIRFLINSDYNIFLTILIIIKSIFKKEV